MHFPRAGVARMVALLVAAPCLALVSTDPVAAATGCDAPETTWRGPATPEGSASWAELSNWTNGVPTAESVVCIPATTTGPRVVEETQAKAEVVTLEGTLAVAGSLDVATLEGDFGELHGPGITTVTGRLSGTWLTLEGAAVVDLREHADLGGELYVYDGSTLNVRGDTSLEPGARIDSLSDNPGLFTITEGGSLTFDAPNESANVIGGFANHGAVTVTAGDVLMMGAGSHEHAHPDEFSTGSFVGAEGAHFNVANTELRNGASLDHVQWVDHINVPDENTVTVADSALVDFGSGPDDPAGPPSFTGAGELVVTDGTVLGARIGGSLSVTVPAGEVVNLAGTLRDQAHLQVYGEAIQIGDLYLDDEAILDIYGVHRASGGYGAIDFSGDDPGVEIIHPAGQLLSDDDSGLVISAPFVNWGTVDGGQGFIHIGPRVASPNSQGTFRADHGGSLLLGSDVVGAPPLLLGSSDIEGDVEVSGEVHGYLDVRGEISTIPGGRLELPHVTMADGSSIAGDVKLGELWADLGPTGTASLSGAEVTDAVLVESGTLSVPSLAPSTLAEDGTLSRGSWLVWPGATLDLPAVTTNDTWLKLLGPGASFGDGLANLTDNGPNGNLVLSGAHLEVSGRLRNEGTLFLQSRSRLDVGGKFRQLTTGWLGISVDAAGRGRVRAAGPRDLAGGLWVRPAEGYKPPVGTVLNFITSNGREGVGDEFDRVDSPTYGANGMRQIRVDYGVDNVRLRVDRVG
jgi:hypothetical protein